MSEKQAEFRFKNFFVLRSVIDYTIGESYDNVGIEIIPQGTYYEKNSLYNLKLDLKIKMPDGNTVIELQTLAQYEFDKEFEEIPKYFTLNAPAIAYPFLRSYVSALTAMSGMDTIHLPIMNLASLADELKKSFTRVKE